MKNPRIFKTISDLWRRQSTPPVDYGTRRQLAESPLQNSSQSQSNCLNYYNCIIHGYCWAFCQYIDKENKNNLTYLIEDITSLPNMRPQR